MSYPLIYAVCRVLYLFSKITVDTSFRTSK